MSGNQVQRPPTVFESVGRQLADTFSLTRSHHRAYGPPAASFSCLDIDGETSLRGATSETPRMRFRTKGQVFFQINRERRMPRSREEKTEDAEKKYNNYTIAKNEWFFIETFTF